jgi:hypothetical protein
MPLSPFHRNLLKEFPDLPLTAIIPLPVAAAVEGCSVKNIRRNYELEKISTYRQGVRKKNLRAAAETLTA